MKVLKMKFIGTYLSNTPVFTTDYAIEVLEIAWEITIYEGKLTISLSFDPEREDLSPDSLSISIIHFDRL